MRLGGVIWVILIFLCSFTTKVEAGELTQRLVEFPHWNNQPKVETPRGNLLYPSWMEGTWDVTSILVEQVAPLAPQIVTPGFAKNSDYLNQPVQFKVRFAPEYPPTPQSVVPSVLPQQIPITPDRACELHLAAYG